MLKINNFKILLKYLLFLHINANIWHGQAFNFAPVPSVIIKEPDVRTYMKKTRSSYFGYSIVLREKSIIIGAPRAQSTLKSQKSINETGAIYRCTLPSENSATASCQPFIFNSNSNIKDKRDNKARHYLYSELQDYQWLGAAMDGSGNDSDKLLACAPGFSGGYDKTEKEIYMHGVCYWSSNTLSEKPKRPINWLLKPLTEVERQSVTTNNETHFYYQLGQAGFSAHITPKNEEFLLGAPGINLWQGSIIRFNTTSRRTYIPKEVVNNFFAYAGYAVSSGYLDKENPKKILYVVTIPHHNKTEFGEAYIFDDSYKYSVKIYKKFNATQYGEFFGYAALVADVDGDGLSDVLITAPLRSLKLQPDVGAVHIFLNKGRFNFTRQLLESPFSSMARFGTSISNLGDINLDGFNDIAIAAPFVDNVGAVAIYLGSPQGLRKKPSQILNHPDPDNILAIKQPYMFGHGLSKGVDIDHNGFNDLAIGAPESEEVFVYHSYPVVRINAFVISDIGNITNVSSELPIKICWQLQTNSTKTNETEIKLELVADPRLRRVKFEKSQTFETQFHEKANGTQQCREVQAQVRYAHISTPIDITMKYGLEYNVTALKEYCNRCAAIDPDSSTIFRYVVFYANGCKGLVCNVDLQLISNHIPENIVQGSSATLPISYDITNKGENAFDAQITISNKPNVAFVKIPRECFLDTASERHKLICQLGEDQQAFAFGATTTINLLLDVSNITTETLTVQADVSSSGFEEKPKDNSVLNIINLEEHAEIIIIAKSLLPSIRLNKANKTLTVESVVELENAGPSTLNDFVFTFWTPVAFWNASLNETYNIFNLNNTFIKTIGIDAFDQQQPSQLSYSKYNSSEFSVQSTTADRNISLPSNRTIKMDCLNSEVICAERNFTVKQFKAHKKITLQISFELESQIVLKLMNDTWDHVVIVPILSIEDSNGSTRNVTINDRINSIILHVVNLKEPTISFWIYILSVCGGLLILSLLIYGLVKMGFFKRKVKDELLRQLEVKKLERYSVLVDEKGE